MDCQKSAEAVVGVLWKNGSQNISGRDSPLRLVNSLIYKDSSPSFLSKLCSAQFQRKYALHIKGIIIGGRACKIIFPLHIDVCPGYDRTTGDGLEHVPPIVGISGRG